MSMTRRATKSAGKPTAAAKARRRGTAELRSQANMRREIAELEARIDRDLALLVAETDQLAAQVLRK